ncbi:MAG: hypothetical protein ACI85F_001177 [Bacteroidia bacterium]|jgi:hypothetical protein
MKNLLQLLLALSFAATTNVAIAQSNFMDGLGDRGTIESESANSSSSDILNLAALIDGELYDAILSENGDTVPIVSLAMVNVKGKRVFKSKRQKRKFLRLERHVRKVYPFAKLANEKLVAYELTLAEMSDHRRKKFMRVAEKEIRKEFSNDLKALTFTQGRILLKLIDRETGNVSYELVKDLRGGFTAWLFQGVAKMFSFDLKADYNPKEDDKLIEEIVVQIEQEELLGQTVSR